MKKSVKKLLALLISVASIVSLFTINASATNELQLAEAELLERGYPQQIIDNLCDEEVLRLASLDGYIYAGSSIVRYNETTGEQTVIDPTEEGIMTLGTIDEDEMQYAFAFSYNYNDQILDVTANYNWSYIPLFRYQDPISVSWAANSGLSYKYNSFHKEDKADGYTTNTQGVTTNYYGHVHSESDVEYDSNSRGVMWFADLMGHQWFSATRLYGYANFSLNCASNPRGKLLYFNYIHSKMANTGNPYLDTEGIAKMNGGQYDSMGNSVTITW